VRTKPEGVPTGSGNWLFSIAPWPIFRYACAALQRLREKRPGGQATTTRLPGACTLGRRGRACPTPTITFTLLVVAHGNPAALIRLMIPACHAPAAVP